MGRGLIHNTHHAIGIYNSHLRTDTFCCSTVQGDIIVSLVQAVLYDIRLEYPVLRRSKPFHAVQPGGIQSFLLQDIFQKRKPLLQPHVTVEQVFIGRLQVEIGSDATRYFINLPRHAIGRGEIHTLLVMIKAK